MLEELLPSVVSCIDAVNDDIADVPLGAEAALIERAVEARRREFLTGRSCARRALARFGVPAIPILAGPNREPLWPSGFVGSITHCSGYRAAAVARQQEVLAVGIDAELHEQLPSGLLQHVALTDEIEWLENEKDGVHWDRVLFSAKECVYKAWFALAKTWLGFEDACIVFNKTAGTFRASLITEAPVGRQIPIGFDGKFTICDGRVLTAIAVMP